MSEDNMMIEDYLKEIGFEDDEIEDILVYASNDTDKKVLYEKLKYLVPLGLDSDDVRNILEQDITFMTEPLELIKSNVEQSILNNQK